MFEAVELGNVVSKEDYREALPPLRLELLKHQLLMKDSDFPVILLLAGDDAVGCRELLQVLNEWLDPRFLEVNALGNPTEQDRQHPEFWRYWRCLPAARRIGVFLGGWTAFGILARIRGELDDEGLDRWVKHAARMEESLVQEGAVLVKIWCHIPKDHLKRRLEQAEQDPEGAWNVGQADREIFKVYDEGILIAERVLRETSTGGASWNVIESTDWRARNLAVGRILLRAISKRLARPPGGDEHKTMAIALAGVESSRTILDTVEHKPPMEKAVYAEKLAKEQAKVHREAVEASRLGISSVLVFEGWDAAGKGGAVRRLCAAIPPTMYRVIPIAAPTDEERAHHYLWRFWRRLPRKGETTIFDRSWYGRVLVERVEGFATREAWRRAYSEIRDFEQQLTEAGIVVIKYWLQIDKDEQERRFQARTESPLKEWKITEEDWRNRERWDDYERAVNEMVQRTSTNEAPWILVAANDKRAARLEVLKTFRKRLQAATSAARG